MPHQCNLLVITLLLWPNNCWSMVLQSYMLAKTVHHVQVSTEGDAFTMAFHDPIDAISWALDVQHKLLLLPWPEQLLEHADAKEQYTPAFMAKQILLFKGLRVRIAMHTGKPDAIQVRATFPGFA